MEDARYQRQQAEHCLRMARHISDPLAANLMRAAAASHFAKAVELEDNAKAKEERVTPSDVSDSFYYRAIRTGVGQGLRTQPVPTEPLPERVLNALRALDGPVDDAAGEEEVSSSAPPAELPET
jgi:hypothetical protein